MVPNTANTGEARNYLKESSTHIFHSSKSLNCYVGMGDWTKLDMLLYINKLTHFLKLN